MRYRFIALLSAVFLILQTSPILAQNLRADLQQALNAKDWSRAIEIVDKLIAQSPTEAPQLQEYKAQLQKRFSEMPASSPSSKTETYLIKGFDPNLLGGSPISLSGSFTTKNNNDDVIDISELSDFNLTFNYEDMNISCGLPALKTFSLLDSQEYMKKFRESGMKIPVSLINLKLNCKSKDVEFSLSNLQLKAKIKHRRNYSQTEQSTQSTGMEVTYSAGTSSGTTEFETTVSMLFIQPQ